MGDEMFVRQKKKYNNIKNDYARSNELNVGEVLLLFLYLFIYFFGVE